MHTFTDSAGRPWSVVVNVSVVKRVKSMLGIDLLSIGDGDLWQRLATDPVCLVDTLFVICKPEAEAAGVTDEQFGAGLVGDVIDAATKALLEEIADFFPQARRGLLRKAMQKTEQLQALTMAEANRRLDNGELENQLKTLLRSSTSSPEPSA
jgi:hypothetical protein